MASDRIKENGHRITQAKDRAFCKWAKEKRLWYAWVPMKLRKIKR